MRPRHGTPYDDGYHDPYGTGESLEDVVDRLFDPLNDPLPDQDQDLPGGHSDQRYDQRYDQRSDPWPDARPDQRPAAPEHYAPGPGPERHHPDHHHRPDPSQQDDYAGWFQPQTPPTEPAAHQAQPSGDVDPLTDPALSYRAPEPDSYLPDPAAPPRRRRRKPEQDPSAPPYPSGDQGQDPYHPQRQTGGHRSAPPGPELGAEPDRFAGQDPLTAPLGTPLVPPGRRSGPPDSFFRPEPPAQPDQPDTYREPDPYVEPNVFSSGTLSVEPETSLLPELRANSELERRPAAARLPAPRAGAQAPFDDATMALRTSDEHGRPLRADAGELPPVGEGRAARRRAARTGGSVDASAESTEAGRAARRRALRAQKPGPGVIASRVVGEMFITCGLLMLLFVTYQLWWTNVLAHRHADSKAKELEEQWEQGGGRDRDAGTFEPGEGFAIMYIPKLDVKVPIAEGIDKLGVLDKGLLGHYSGGDLKSAMPWEKEGNFAVAGHRNTHGEPFRYVNRLVAGDEIIVETKDAFFIYEMANRLPSTPPSNTGVIGPIPSDSGFTKPGRYITLTTCTPEFTSKYRLIVWGKMVEERPRSEGKPDALVG